MSPLIVAVGGALLVAGVLGVVAGSRLTPERPPAPQQAGTVSFLHRLRPVSRRTKVLAGVGAAIGVVVALLTGWLIAIVVIPAFLAGLPVLLAAPPAGAQIQKLEAMEEWTRSLAGVLTVGVGLEQALMATMRSTPEAIRPEVGRLVARLRARWSTEAALRAFADELDDATGDLVAANLVLGARRRGAGLASVLGSLAESVAEDVKARRAVEADRAKPRQTARTVTLITLGVLGYLALTGEYIAPYGTPIGQIVLAVLLSAYVALLFWMRRMAVSEPLPRFIGTDIRKGVDA